VVFVVYMVHVDSVRGAGDFGGLLVAGIGISGMAISTLWISGRISVSAAALVVGDMTSADMLGAVELGCSSGALGFGAVLGGGNSAISGIGG
jgi:hypothetical protein